MTLLIWDNQNTITENECSFQIQLQCKIPKTRGARKRYERERNEEIKTLDHQTSVRKYNRLKMIHIKDFFIKIETNFKYNSLIDTLVTCSLKNDVTMNILLNQEIWMSHSSSNSNPCNKIQPQMSKHKQG